MNEADEPTSGPVLTLSETALTERGHGEGFASANAPIGQMLGLAALGAQLYRVPPGKKAWPYHCHYENDEFIVVLEGEGELRFGAERFSAKAGDVIGCPAGGPETAHQLINAGASDLVYLCVSSMRAPEVMEYPDSGKIGVLSGKAALGPGDARLRYFGRRHAEVDYWEDES